MNNTTKTVLVIGNGGREHAIISAIKKSPLLKEVYTTSESFADFATFVPINPNNFLFVSHFCKNNAVDLVVIGPEQYLADGLSDVLNSEGISVFGPSKTAAKLESAKAFTKEICEMYNIPTAKSSHFIQPNLAKQYVAKMQGKVVIKVNGLASGKGVFICNNQEEACNVIDKILIEKAFGSSGDSIIIEEFLEGDEISFFIVSDGKSISYFGSAKDYKHVYVDGKLLNTGGMGSYSFDNIISPQVEQKIIRDIIYPTINGLAAINTPYVGILFAGIILTKTGPKLLEYNVRFGDPEAQVLLKRIKSDFLDMMLKTVRGKLSEFEIQFNKNVALCVVMASEGYPLDYKTGIQINGIVEASSMNEIDILYAGIKVNDGKYYSNGGRVLNVVASDNSLSSARKKAYHCIESYLKQDGLFYLKNIGEE